MSFLRMGVRRRCEWIAGDAAWDGADGWEQRSAEVVQVPNAGCTGEGRQVAPTCPRGECFQGHEGRAGYGSDCYG